jgi:hypothetical protein
MKGLPIADLPREAERLAAAVKAESARRRVRAVMSHEDCDALEPEDDNVQARIESSVRVHVGSFHAVVPAWELEAWWFMWPEAVASVRRAWRAPDDYIGRRVGLIEHAKEKLQQAIRPSGIDRSRFPNYTESDSVRIAINVREMGIANAPLALSSSYERFRKQVDTL